jgi:hypothetical protein
MAILPDKTFSSILAVCTEKVKTVLPVFVTITLAEDLRW